MEQAFSHNQVKLQFTMVLKALVQADELGYVFADRMLLSNPRAGVSNEPDAMFVSFDGLDAGRVTLVPSTEAGSSRSSARPTWYWRWSAIHR